MEEEPNLELRTMRITFQIFHSAVRPSQGLLNFIVFLGQKAYDRRRIDNTLTWKQAMRTVIFDREYPRYVMSDLDMLHQDDHRRQQIQKEEEDRREDYSEYENHEYDNANDDADANNDRPAGVCGLELSAGIRNSTLPPLGRAAFLMSRATIEYDGQNESCDPSGRNSGSLDAFDTFLDDSHLSSTGTQSRTRSTSASRRQDGSCEPSTHQITSRLFLKHYYFISSLCLFYSYLLHDLYHQDRIPDGKEPRTCDSELQCMGGSRDL